MKWIHVTKEYYTCVDEEDFAKVSQYLWRYLHKSGYSRCDRLDDITLHEFLLGKAIAGFEIDYINRAPWDNRRSNLRTVERRVNQKNQGIPTNPPFPNEQEMREAKEARRNLKYGPIHKELRSAVRKRKVCDDKGNVFSSMKEAAQFYSLSHINSISLCCQGKQARAHGIKWSYV